MKRMLWTGSAVKWSCGSENVCPDPASATDASADECSQPSPSQRRKGRALTHLLSPALCAPPAVTGPRLGGLIIGGTLRWERA